MEEEIKKSYYAIIPANIRYDKDITPNAKLLYGEITALCNEKGFCWASNDYFSKLYEVSKVSVSKWINSLIKKGYIESKLIYKENSKEIDKRVLLISNLGIKEKFNTYLTEVKYPIKEKFNTPIKEKFKDNITLINNTINNNIEETKVSNSKTNSNNVSLNLEKEKKLTPAQKTIKEKGEFIEALEMAGAFKDYAEELANMRIKKKLSLSKIVYNKFIRECNGIDINDAIEICITKGWQGFERTWYDNLKQTKQNEQQQIDKIGRTPVEQLRKAGSTIDFTKFQ